MRSALLFLLALGVFLAGFFALAWLMPDPESGPPPISEVAAPPLKPSERVIGEIKGVTLRSHDQQTGAPLAEVQVAEYRRLSDKQVQLRDIEATILMQDGAGVVTLSAPQGDVELDTALEAEDILDANTLGTADVARLRDVTIRWYDRTQNVRKGPAAAILTLRVDNLVYDNNQFSLFTDDTEIGGATVLADDVPVEVRGRDYDFDGRGLLVRWDAETRRPLLVRIAHGERLTIKTEDGFMPTKIVGGKAGPLPDMLASIAPAALRDAIQVRPLHVYRATMTQSLRARQGGITKLEADTAIVHFALDAKAFQQSEPTMAAAPATQSTRLATPTTQPDPEQPFEPITLSWEGPLLIEAQSSSDAQPLASADDMRLHLWGAPLVLREQGVEARGAELSYAKLADELEILGSDLAPVTLVEAEGSTLVTARLLAHPNVGTATAAAPGYAEVAAGEAESVRLRWGRECDFAFSEGRGGQQELRSVRARGAVTVRHPEISLDSEELDVELEPSQDDSERPEIRTVLARGEVRSAIAAGDGDTASLSSQRLTLNFERGLDGPITALAEGSVSSVQHGQTLAADELQASLKPDETGEHELVELTAQGNVKGSDEEGRRYSAALLKATPLALAGGEDAEPQHAAGSSPALRVRLAGSADRPAEVEMGDDRLAAAVLEFNSLEETVHVPGGGQMHTVQQSANGREMPFVVTWTGQMHGNRDEVRLEDQVNLKGAQEPAPDSPVEAFVDLMSDSALLKLTPGAVPEPAEPPQAPTTRAADLAGSVRQITLESNIRATVEERQADTLLRSFDLRAQALDAWPGHDTARLVIESPGRVLVRDLRPPPSPDPSAPATRPSAEGFRGSAAVEWSQHLSFEPESGELVLRGGVTLAVEPVGHSTGEARAGRAFNLNADSVRVQTQESAQGKLEMKSAVAEGNARFATEGLSFEGEEVHFDPISQLITARGAVGRPVVVFDGAGVPTGRFSELVYNLQSGQVERLTDLGAGG